MLTNSQTLMVFSNIISILPVLIQYVMKIKSLALVCCILFIALACKKDDEENVIVPDPPNNPVNRVEKSTYTLNGQLHSANDIQIQVSSNPEVLDITSSFDNGATTQLEMSPIRDEGSYSTSQTLGFGVVIGTQAWLCNTGCTVVVHEHDEEDGWYDVTISGELQDPFSSATATLNEARISVFY